MKLAICGLAGVGKGSLGAALAKKHHLPRIVTGEVFKDIAVRRGITPQELEILAITDRSIDKEVDDAVRAFARLNNDCIIDGRLASRLVPDARSILLRCDDDIRFHRIAQRDKISWEKAEERTIAREEALVRRFGLPLSMLFRPALYNHVFDTTRYGQFQVLVQVEDMVFVNKPRAA